MYMQIDDEREDIEVRLLNIEINGFFIWNEIVFRRVEVAPEIKLVYSSNTIPVIMQRDGRMLLLENDTWVVPCECRLVVEA